jgi:hypothetical protein
MSTVSDFEKELEVQEKKHKKILKYDMEILTILILAAAFVAVASLVLKSAYKPVKEAKSGLAPALIECNQSILRNAETYMKNSTHYAARESVDARKKTFDAAIGYYGTVTKKGTREGLILDAFDSCYNGAVQFRNVFELQEGLSDAGISDEMLAGMDNRIKLLKVKRDSLVAGIEAYNATGFFLAFSWLTPYPGTIEYKAPPLPELQPIIDSSHVSSPKPK